MTRRVALAVALLVVAIGLHRGRRAFITAVTTNDAPPGAAPVLPAGRTPDAREIAGLGEVERVRVVLLDGVGAATAARLPSYDGLCRGGLDLVVDVGFPTVSLPVELALWSGLSQQQSGILFRSGRPLVPPLRGVPSDVPDSVAVAESHPEIVQSLGFGSAQPPLEGKPPDGWAEAGFRAAALAAVAGPSRLAFVHVLRVDSAGHASGAASRAYADAAASADQLLGELVTAAGGAAAPGVRWFVLADHGHLPGGGHGGEEPAIRQVRACIAGTGVAPGRGGPIHLVDYSRAIADSLGVSLPARAVGRPLFVALGAPLTGEAHLPRPSGTARLIALLLLAVGAAATAAAARRRPGVGQVVAAARRGPAAAAAATPARRRGGTVTARFATEMLTAMMRPRLRWSALPWWWLIAIASLWLLAAPSLSSPAIYKPLGRDLYLAALPGLIVLAIAGGAGLRGRRGSPWRFVLCQLALPLAAIAAALVLCGGAPLLVGVPAAPLMPRWTAWTSALAVVGVSGAVVAALAVLASCVRRGSGRAGPSGTPRSPA